MRVVDVVAMDRDGNRLSGTGRSNNLVDDANTRVTAVQELMVMVGVILYSEEGETKCVKAPLRDSSTLYGVGRRYLPKKKSIIGTTDKIFFNRKAVLCTKKAKNRARRCATVQTQTHTESAE